VNEILDEFAPAPIELDAEQALLDALWAIGQHAEIAARFVALRDIHGCIYALRCLRAYDDAAVKAVKLISDKRAALDKAREGSPGGPG
jgi:hypothetical protein